jgi:hypothetical protein
VFILKKKNPSPELAGLFHSNLAQIILRYGEFLIVQIKGQVLLKGEIILKKQKWGGLSKNLHQNQ